MTSALQLANPDTLVLAQDIYNERKQLQLQNLAGRSPIEAMVYELKQMDFFYQYKTLDTGEVTHVFFAHPKSIELYQWYPEVLLMDCTYKTNRFGMPLLNIMGTTSLGTTYYLGFIFLSGETEEDYLWALKELKIVMKGKDIIDPGVVITDRELALMNALEIVFPKTANLLCEWHISKAVLTYIKRERIFKKKGQRDDDEEAQKEEVSKQDNFMV